MHTATDTLTIGIVKTESQCRNSILRNNFNVNVDLSSLGIARQMQTESFFMSIKRWHIKDIVMTFLRKTRLNMLFSLVLPF